MGLARHSRDVGPSENGPEIHRHFRTDKSLSAVQFVGSVETKVILIDGKQFAEFMIDHGIGLRSD